MIIRVLHEGQYDLADEPIQRINGLDERLFQAVVEGNSGAFGSLLEQVLAIVREEGHMLATEDLRPSDLVLPAPDSTMDEVRALFEREGLLRTA